MTYSQIAWLPLTGGLTLLGLILSWLAWRRRGLRAGLRGAAWSLLPVALYLIGAIQLLWRFGTAIGSFATSFVFSPRVWAGVAVAGLAMVLFVVSGLGRRAGRAGGKPDGAQQPHPGTLARTDGRQRAVTSGTRRSTAPPDDDLKDIEAILRRRGIT